MSISESLVRLSASNSTFLEEHMRKLIVAEHISLDGVIQSPGAPDEDASGDFRLGGWTVPYGDELIGEALQDLFSQPFDLLLGRRTYDIWATYWPHQHDAIADQFNRVAKHVATHRPDSLGWKGSHALKGELAEAVRALKKVGEANLMTWGSGEMVNQLLAAGLVDELWLFRYPVVLGHGKRLFDGDSQASSFSVAYSKNTSDGVAITRFERGGEVRTGTFRK